MGIGELKLIKKIIITIPVTSKIWLSIFFLRSFWFTDSSRRNFLLTKEFNLKGASNLSYKIYQSPR